MKKLIISLFFMLSFCSLGVSARIIESAQADLTHLTIYSDRALISEERLLELPEGEAELVFKGIASEIRPETLLFQDSSGLTLLSQRYNGYPFTNADLMNYFTGKEVKLVRYLENSKKTPTETARIIAPSHPPLFEIGGELHLGHPGTIVFPEIPAEFPREPALHFRIISDDFGERDLAVTYITGGVSWSADYSILLSSSEKKASIKSYASLHNSTLTEFSDVTMSLVAGDLASDYEVMPMMMVAETLKASRVDTGFGDRQVTREEFSDYHIYKLAGKRSLRGGERRQELIFEEKNFPVTREYVFEGNPQHFFYRFSLEEFPLASFISFKNIDEEGPGLPLPAGQVRVYTLDSSGLPRLSGTSSIGHTPVGEQVQIRTGDSFDITGERRQLSYKLFEDERIYETSWKITVNNAREEEVRVKVVEPMRGSWEIIEFSEPFEKEDAFRAVFYLTVPPASSKSLTYT
ncbi:MAG: DUF4139 domain-containing protein, partial [Elusimicrobia bacterium]|nr:DUF4139 domain-containing protein [Elusimicrobiota bacterium]